MIHGIGIDTIEIDRFTHWHSFSTAQLRRIFSVEEISYCLESERLRAQRFAIRFAAREAFFKALQSGFPDLKLLLLPTCRALSILRNNNGLPKLIVNWDVLAKINSQIKPLKPHLSLTHSRNLATAIVILSH